MVASTVTDLELSNLSGSTGNIQQQLGVTKAYGYLNLQTVQFPPAADTFQYVGWQVPATNTNLRGVTYSSALNQFSYTYSAVWSICAKITCLAGATDATFTIALFSYETQHTEYTYSLPNVPAGQYATLSLKAVTSYPRMGERFNVRWKCSAVDGKLTTGVGNNGTNIGAITLSLLDDILPP
jgi:hypothetical protein